MKILKQAALLLILFISVTVLRANSGQTDDIANTYRSFRYNETITLCQALIADSLQHDSTEIINAYLYQGLSNYALGNMDQAFSSFIDLLSRDPEYAMDPARTPPKILRFYNGIKAEFTQFNTPALQSESIKMANPDQPARSSLLYSFILPGSGHIREGDRTKGWVLAAASAATLASTIYFSIETNIKEEDYLHAVEKDVIARNYDAYNQAYKQRNISAVLFAAVWIYTQIDLIKLDPSSVTGSKNVMQIGASLGKDLTPVLSLNYRF